MRYARSAFLIISMTLAMLFMTALPSYSATAPGIIGAWVVGPSSSWEAASSSFGPLQSARVFYNGALPASYAGSLGSDLPAGVTLVVSYNTPDTNVSSFVCSIPSTRNVILSFYHEPENRNAPFATGADFVAEFNAQSAEIRAAATSCGVTTVKIAMIAMTWAYADTSRRGYSCSFIPPAASVDYYLADTYEHNEETLAADPGFQRWNTCTAGPVPQGLAEYAVGLGNPVNSGCQFTDANRASVIQTDDAYLTANFPNFVMWEYSWVAFNAPCGGQYQFPVGGQSAATWQAIATGAPLPPVISIAQPASNATVAGTVTVSGTASDSAGVTQVQVSVDNGTPQPASGTSNWSAAIDTTTLTDGTHTITVQATDANAATGTASVTVNVRNNGTHCPSPAGGITELSGNVSLEADQTGWTGHYNGNTVLTRLQPAGGSYDGSYALQVAPKSAGAAGVNNASPLWVPGPPGLATTAGQVYTGSAFVQASVAGEKVTLLVKESNSGGGTVGSASDTVTLGDTSWHQITAAYTAKATGDLLHYTLYVSNFTGSSQHLLADCLSLQTP